MKSIGRIIDATRLTSARTKVFALSVAVLGTCFTSLSGFAADGYPAPPNNLIDGSPKKTVKAAAKDGWVPCPGQCLKLSQKGWVKKDAPGHPPTDWWMVYPFTIPGRGNSWQAYTQQHCGHLIQVYPDRNAQDVGLCPVCHGTGWVRNDDPNVKK